MTTVTLIYLYNYVFLYEKPVKIECIATSSSLIFGFYFTAILQDKVKNFAV